MQKRNHIFSNCHLCNFFFYFQMSFAFKRRANLPYNRRGRITPYTKDGGRKAYDKGGTDSGLVRHKSRQSAPTMDQIQSDRLTKFANDFWSPQTAKSHSDYNPEIIDNIYQKDLNTAESNIRRVMMLEFSQYLENYLWPNFDEKATKSHVMSIVYMVNEKFRERVPAWIPFQKKDDKFTVLFQKVMEHSLNENESEISLKEQTALLIFLGHCFMSMEIDLVRSYVQKLVSLSMWQSLIDSRRDQELKNVPKWKKFWKAVLKRDGKETDENVKMQAQKERFFLKNLIEKFVKVLNKVDEKSAPENVVTYCEHFMLFMIDIEALLPTRRFFNTVMDDSKLIIHGSLSVLSRRDEGKLFSQLLDQLKFYARFEISDESGDALNDKAMMQIHYNRITSLQKAMFAKYPDNPEMRKFALATVASVDDRENLGKHFKDLDKEVLYDIAQYLFLVPDKSTINLKDYSKKFLIELLIYR